MRIYIAIITMVVLSCSQKRDTEPQSYNSPGLSIERTQTDSRIQESTDSTNERKQRERQRILDSIPSFIVDDYPITDSMIRQGGDYPQDRILNGDGPWYSSGQEVLVFHLHTDNYRYATFHFIQGNVPIDLMNSMELHTPSPGSSLADIATKREFFSKLFPPVNELDRKYFTSNKGIKLGDSKSKVMMINGPPDSSAVMDGSEVYYWSFQGDEFYEIGQALDGKPLAKDSFGHQIKMYFRENKLIAVFLHNDIP